MTVNDVNDHYEKDDVKCPERKVDKAVQARVIVIFDTRRLTKGFDGAL